ncbi:MAG: UvrD-helicase domain-containing protein, partial [Paludibacteraceae bacterium]|nr:UvrD-helicase domain-containing protein [Paludibacteraceae bacterium]
MDFLSNLNESQRAAVLYNDGPQLVVAGAGSGKTRVLTYKIAYLLSQGVQANRILALTFTNKAAREMKERINSLVGYENAKYLWMGTFHSICTKILRKEADKLGFTRDFSIYDTTDMKSVVKEIIKMRGLDDKVYKPSTVLSKISAAKNAFMSVEAYAMDSEINKQNRFDRMYDMAEIYKLYQLRLRAANAMDFDDLLVNLCKLLREDASALHYYQQMFQYVLVDEYQDTNYVQYLIVKMLSEPENKVCVVGDDAQSIYSFRGADIRNILTFQQGYSNAKLFKLEQNYRSTQTIVKAANSLIHKNAHQIYKEVYSEKEEGDRLQ